MGITETFESATLPTGESFILNDLQLSAHFSYSTALLEVTRKSAK